MTEIPRWMFYGYATSTGGIVERILHGSGSLADKLGFTLIQVALWVFVTLGWYIADRYTIVRRQHAYRSDDER